LAIGNRQSVITLLTDFGTRDYFVGAMKGVILSINPAAQIVDITHEIPPQDIQAAAFNLLAAYRDFPPGTIHAAVVDPGVGSSRRPIMIECAERYFVGPDNGLFSWICEREGKFRTRLLTNEKFFRNPVSGTFHGRDVFAPVAAALSNGVEPDEFGPVIDDLVRLESLKPKTTDKGIEARIIHIDRFGNCITNLTRDLFTRNKPASRPRLDVNGMQVTSFREFFADAGSDSDELFIVIGSAGFAEIAARNRSAASIVNARRGQSIFFTRHEDN
jgi:S-adenosyl-L-methionine hydrolase (adenosine-forming)